MNKPCSVLFTLFGAASLAQAASISVDFNNTNVASWVVTGTAGPLGTGNWNNTNSGSGGPSALVNDSAAATTATITWSSSGTYTQGDGNSTQDRRLAHAYLDDGSGGVSITVNNVPYDAYRVYGLISSGQNGDNSTYTTLDFQVNGTWVLDQTINGGGASAATATAHGDMDSSGGGWVAITGDGAGNQLQTGNYWTIDSSGATLTINGLQRSGNDRGSITGIIIEQIPEPSTALLGSLAGLFLLRRRRR